MMQVVGFLGKGGVGKTTISCAIAHLLQKSGKSIAYISLDQQMNHEQVKRENGLDFVSFNMSGTMSEFIESIIKHTGLTPYVETAPTIARDLVAICEMSKLLFDLNEKKDYEYIVVDFPPNHASIQMLNIPDVLRSGMKRYLKAKYRVQDMLHKERDNTVKDVERLFKIMTEARNLIYGGMMIPIGIPTELGIYELQNIRKYISDNNLNSPASILNFMPSEPETDCRICNGRWKNALKIYGNIRREHPVVISEGDFDSICRDLTVLMDYLEACRAS